MAEAPMTRIGSQGYAVAYAYAGATNTQTGTAAQQQANRFNKRLQVVAAELSKNNCP